MREGADGGDERRLDRRCENCDGAARSAAVPPSRPPSTTHFMPPLASAAAARTYTAASADTTRICVSEHVEASTPSGWSAMWATTRYTVRAARFSVSSRRRRRNRVGSARLRALPTVRALCEAEVRDCSVASSNATVSFLHVPSHDFAVFQLKW